MDLTSEILEEKGFTIDEDMNEAQIKKRGGQMLELYNSCLLYTSTPWRQS